MASVRAAICAAEQHRAGEHRKLLLQLRFRHRIGRASRPVPGLARKRLARPRLDEHAGGVAGLVAALAVFLRRLDADAIEHRQHVGVFQPLLAELRAHRRAIDRHHGERERHVHLRRGDARRPIWPRAMPMRHRGAVDDDARDVDTRERVLAHDVVEQAERRVDARRRRIGLEADLADLPGLAEALGEPGEVRLAAQRREEAAIGGFENVGNAGEAAPRQHRAGDAHLRGVAGVQPLHHRAFLRRHQPGGERAGDAEGVLGLASRRAASCWPPSPPRRTPRRSPGNGVRA